MSATPQQQGGCRQAVVSGREFAAVQVVVCCSASHASLAHTVHGTGSGRCRALHVCSMQPRRDRVVCACVLATP